MTMTQAESRFYRTAADQAQVDATRLHREAFESPGRLAAELLRIATFYGYPVDTSDEVVRSAARVAAVLLPVLVAPDVTDEPARQMPGAAPIQGRDLREGHYLIAADETMHHILEVRPANDVEKARAGCDDLLVADSVLGWSIQFTSDEELFIVERQGGEVR